jgi:hypothetical protein
MFLSSRARLASTAGGPEGDTAAFPVKPRPLRPHGRWPEGGYRRFSRQAAPASPPCQMVRAKKQIQKAFIPPKGDTAARSRQTAPASPPRQVARRGMPPLFPSSRAPTAGGPKGDTAACSCQAAPAPAPCQMVRAKKQIQKAFIPPKGDTAACSCQAAPTSAPCQMARRGMPPHVPVKPRPLRPHGRWPEGGHRRMFLLSRARFASTAGGPEGDTAVRSRQTAPATPPRQVARRGMPPRVPVTPRPPHLHAKWSVPRSKSKKRSFPRRGIPLCVPVKPRPPRLHGRWLLV